MRDGAQLSFSDGWPTVTPESTTGVATSATRGKSRSSRSPTYGTRPDPGRISFISSPVVAKKFQLVPIDDVDFARETVDLVQGLLPNSGLAVVYGPSGSGKSFMVLDVALHVATGRPYAGREVKPSGVIYIAAEGVEGFRRRVVAARDRLEARGVPFAMIADAPNLGGSSNDVEDLLRAIHVHSAKVGWTPGLVVIDTLARAMPGLDENSSRDMGTFIAHVDRVGRELGCLMLVVHHTGKNEGAGMRGSSALRGAAEVVWSVSFGDGVRVVTLEKSRDGKDNLRWSYDIEEVVLVEGEGGKPITTCVVVGVTEPTLKGVTRAAKSEVPKSKKLFSHAFDIALAAHGENMWPDGNDGRQVHAVRRDMVRNEYMQRHDAKNVDSRRRAFERSLAAAIDSEAVVSVDPEGVGYLFKP